jgi:putative endonuclease
MLSGRLTQLALRTIDRIAPNRNPERPAHLRTGRRGEEDAYFYLRRRGYVMVARNYRTARYHGEIDLIGWDKEVLCFIEVKTRTTRDVKPAEAAVDRKKRRDLRAVIRDYLRTLPRRQFPEPPAWRFDVVTVHYDRPANSSQRATKDSRSNRGGLDVEYQQTPSHPAAKGGTTARQPAYDRRAAPHTFELFQNAALSS